MATRPTSSDPFMARITHKHTRWVRPRWVSLVKTYLIERGITIRWFCDKTGITTAHFAQIERGERNAPTMFRSSAALVLQRPVDELFVKVQVTKPSDIIYERDPLDDRRIIRLFVEVPHGNATREELVWELSAAPWRMVV